MEKEFEDMIKSLMGGGDGDLLANCERFASAASKSGKDFVGKQNLENIH